jgi:hypothetical protein
MFYHLQPGRFRRGSREFLCSCGLKDAENESVLEARLPHNARVVHYRTLSR